MSKKNKNTIDKELIDPVTELLNHKGFSAMYMQKKNIKPKNYTSITILEINNFSKENKQYPPEIIQAILRKIAFTLGLFEQSADVMARTDFNQFSIILSRPSKEQCLKEIEKIVQTIEEIRFKLPKGNYENIKVTGSFIIKIKSRSLEDAIKEALVILEFAKNKNGITIAQKRDFADLQI
jgi:diguanylate cyclase (GGDEF)-like protein